MKRLLLVLNILLLLLMVSCKKKIEFNNYDYGKIDYYVMGVYIEIEKTGTYERNDANPKIFFDFADKDVLFSTNTGYGTSSVLINNQAKSVNEIDGVKVYHGVANLTIRDEDLKKVRLYPIYSYPDKSFSVNTENYEDFELSNNSYQFLILFTNNKQKYKIELNLLFKKEG